ncbi:MAG: peptidase domain-containing ABC transporter [Clostridiales bacterium]|nr:peptidase domain-containing ABC transporter [Clostridiales bacterium]
MNFFKKYPYVKQLDKNDCGPACLATVLKYYGYKASIAKLRELMKTDINGTTIYGIMNATKKLNMSAKAVNAKNKEVIKKEFPKPAIAHVVYEDGMNHYVVLYEVNNEGVVVADTGRGILKYTFEEFYKIWSGKLIILVPNNSFEKGNKTNGYKRFWDIIRLQKPLIIGTFFVSLLITIFGICGSLYYKFLIDDIIPNNLYNKLIYISITMIILAFFKAITEFLRRLLLMFMAKNIDIKLLLGYYNHIVKLPIEFFETRDVGSIISRFNDGIKIREAISTTAVTVMMDTIMAVVGGIILYMQSSTMFYFCFIPIIIYLVLVAAFKSKIEENNKNEMENYSKVTSYSVETIEGMEVIKSFNAEDEVIGKLKDKFMDFVQSTFSNEFIINLQEMLKGIVKAIFGIVILWIGAYLTLQGNLTVGTFISFNALLVYFIEPIERVINLQSQIQSALVAADRLGQILDLEIENQNIGKEISSLSGDIEINNITFRYGCRRIILKDFSLKIKNKEKVALVGSSGSGKTTLVKILMKFYEIENGQIKINSYDINDIAIKELRDRIAYISQDSYFFSGTIKENLLIGNKNVTEEEMVNICKKVYIHDLIMSFPKGYDNILAEKAMNLSGGQRQRLAIARALLKKPDILIMDEATSNLDSITEKAIEKTVKEFTKDITTIIIAHRLSSIKNCDTIYVIEDGKVIESGNHEELINKQEHYYKLWKEQDC